MSKNVKMNNKTYYHKTTDRRYTEVDLDLNGEWAGRYNANPLAKMYQYEYALFAAASKLFAAVECCSLCIESLKLYFSELPAGRETASDAATARSGRRTREGFLSEMSALVARDVSGNITFPMMDVCAATVHVIPEADGAHSFVFTDGIYGFHLRPVFSKDGTPVRIEVGDLSENHRESTPDTQNVSGGTDKRPAGRRAA